MKFTRERLVKMVGFILYSCGVLLVGFMGGMMAKHIIDRETVRDLSEEKRRLHRENAYLKKLSKHEVIEITDKRGEKELEFGGF